MPKKIDMKGKRFGRLLVVKEIPERSKNHEVMWECICDCGNTTTAPTGGLLKGFNLSCGCLNREKSRARIIENGYTPEVNVDGADTKHILEANTPKTNTSGHKGVTFDKSRNLWRAQIVYGYKCYTLKKSKNINDCILARLAAEKAVEKGDFLSWLAEYKENKTKKGESLNG